MRYLSPVRSRFERLQGQLHAAAKAARRLVVRGQPSQELDRLDRTGVAKSLRDCNEHGAIVGVAPWAAIGGASLGSDVSVRAALHLCRDYGQEQQVGALRQAGKSPRKDAVRGLAAAALYDCGQQSEALGMAAELEASRQLPAVGWSSLVRASTAGASVGVLVTEANFRRVQQGSCE